MNTYIDSASHLLFICDNFSALRGPLWDNVTNKMPEQMVQHVTRLNAENKTRFILSGLNASFTKEWLEIYGAISLFVHCMYAKKVEVLNNSI